MAVEGEDKMFKLRKITLFLLGLCMVAVLCACNDTKPVEEPNSDESSFSEELSLDQEIVVGIAQDLGDSLDPYQMTAAGTREVLFNVYEGLVKPNKDGDFIPAVAKELPEISEDGRTYTFTLRENVQFHNGTAVTADDVAYSFETCAATTVDTALGVAFSLVEDIETAGENTVIIHLNEANADMLSYFASIYITPQDYTEQSTHPIGTGPFKFVSRTAQDSLVLEKFADYWGETAKVDRVTFKIYEHSATMMSALHAGTLDMATHLTIDQVRTINEDEYNVVEGTMNLVQALYLNHAKEPFDNELVRKALCYAIDVDEIQAITSDGHGTKLGTSIYPAFGKYFDESLADAYLYEPDTAKALLTEAGYPDGFTMTITVPSNYTPHVNVAEVMAEQLGRVGVTVNLELVEWSTWLSQVYNERDYETTVIGFDATTLTAGALLNRWVSTDGKNMINYNNQEYDALIQEAKSTTDDVVRTQLYKDAAAILSETAANVYIQDMADFLVMKNTISGYQFYPLYVMDLSNIAYVN